MTQLPNAFEALGQDFTWGGYSWKVYNGTGALGQKWLPGQVSVGATGNMHLSIDNESSGGLSMLLNQRYGSWRVTFRMTRGPGKYVLLLWPQTGNRPEVDFAEDRPTGDSQRTYTTATFHPDLVTKHEIHATLPGDFTRWHTAEITWGKKHYNLYMDGTVWARFPDIGAGPMHLSLQTSNVSAESGSSILAIYDVTVKPL